MAYGGQYYQENIAKQQGLANGYANHAHVFNNESMWMADAIAQQFTGMSIDQMSPNMQYMMNMVLPNLMQQIPGQMDFSQQYGSILSAVNSSGQFNNKGAAERTGLAHSLQMMMNSTIYSPSGKQSLVNTGGMTGELIGSSTGAFMTELLKGQTNIQTQTTDLFGGKSGNDAIRNMMSSTDSFTKSGQMSNREKKWYGKINELNTSMNTEAAITAYYNSIGMEANDETAARFKALSQSEKDSILQQGNKLLEADPNARAAYINSAIDSAEERNKFGKGSLFTGAGYSDPNMLETVRKAHTGQQLDFEHFSDDTAKEIQDKMKDALPKFGRNVSQLAKIFNTEDFNELQSAVDELGWGVLASEKDVENIRTNLNQSYAMAAATNRDILSIITEKKELAQFAATTSGGKNMVSFEHVDDLQRVRNQALYNESIDAVKTQDRVTADFEKGYQNDLEYAGNIAGAMGIMQNTDLLNDSQKAKANKLIEQFYSAMASGDASTMEQANEELGAMLEDFGQTGEQIQHAGKNFMPRVSADWAKAATVYQYRELLANMDDQVFSGSQQDAMVKGLETGVKGLLGTDTSKWKQVLDTVGSGSAEENVNALMQSWGLGDTYRGQVSDLVGSLKGLDKQQRAHIFSMMNGGQTHEVIGGLSNIQENIAYTKDMMMSNSVATESDDMITNLIMGLVTDDKELTVGKYIKASLNQYRMSNKNEDGSVLSEEEAFKALSGEGGALEGSVYFGKLNAKDGSVDDTFKKNLDKHLKETGSEYTSEDFLVEGTNVLDTRKFDAYMQGRAVLDDSGRILYASDKAQENANAENRRMSQYDNMDMATFMKQGGKLTKQNASLLGLTIADDGTILESQYDAELLGLKRGEDGKIEGSIDDVNNFIAQKTADGKTLGQQIADRQNTGENIGAQTNRLVGSAVGYLKQMTEYLDPDNPKTKEQPAVQTPAET